MKRVTLSVDADQAGRRLDQFLAGAQPETSRSDVQRDIRAGRITVAGDVARLPSRRLREHEVVVWDVPDRALIAPHPIPLVILYEDEHLVAIDKPCGLVVHPGAGTRSTTLVEGLLAGRKLPASDDPARPGIVHRLDKETSGVILVAKSTAALRSLQHQFSARTVGKSYIAVVGGLIREGEGAIDAPIGRDPAAPRRMSVQPRGRTAQTEFHVLRRLEDSTLLHAQPHTGRTHQIRVHFHYIGHPVLGDAVYGPPTPRESTHGSMRRRPSSIAAPKEQPGDTIYGVRTAREQARAGDAVHAESRLMLHAWRIVVRHPETAEILRLEAPVPSTFPSYPYHELPWGDGPGPE